MKVLAITSCPNGIAHTYMAAENLEKAARELDITIKVETQGGVGAENVLTEDEIAKADGIIIAADRAVDKSRFHGKKVLSVGVQEGIRNPKELIKKIENGNVPIYQEGSPQSNTQKNNGGNAIYRHLMNGVSFMVPFIVVGGLLLAISLSLGGETTKNGLVIPEDSFWISIQKIGEAGFHFMVPILAGYIAYSIADKPGLVPGMIGGFIAADGSFYGSEAGAGFLGGIVAGFLAGYIALWIKKIKVPKAVLPIMPIIIIPVLSTVAVGLIFILLIGNPISAFFTFLTDWLKSMQGTNAIVLAMIIGAMIAFDMGGPVNKVAFLFGAAMIGEGNYSIMGMVAAAVCTPPIGLGIATFFNKRKFNANEIEMGKASFTMGLFGITEGAIPFAAQDPLRVIPSIMVGSITGSVIASIGNVGDRVAHGGPIVAVLGGIDNILMFAIAVVVGSIVTAVMLILIKRPNTQNVVAPQNIEDNSSTKINSEQTNSLFDKQTIIVNRNNLTQEEVMDEMIEKLYINHYISDKDKFKKAILNREKQSTTGIGMEIAIPHAKVDVVQSPIVAVMKSETGIDWNSLDGTKSHLIFMIAVPDSENGNTHLQILQKLSRKLMDDDYRQSLIATNNKEEIYSLLQQIK